MNRIASRLAAAAALVSLPLTGCANIQLGPPKAVHSEVLRSSEREIELEEPVLAAERQGSHLVVSVQNQCGTQRVDRVLLTEHRERSNATPGRDWALGILGGLSVGVGGAFVIDSGNVYSADDTASRTYNSTGPDDAKHGGLVAVGVGLGLVAVAVTDVLRAQGSEETTREVTEKSDAYDLEPCQPVPDVELVLVGLGQPQTLGKTNATGTLRIDAVDAYALLTAATTISGTAADLPEMRVVVSEPAKGAGSDEERPGVHIPEPALRALAREGQWIEAKESCEQPTTADACAPLYRFLREHPDDVHADAAKTLVLETAPLIDDLRRADEEARRAEEAKKAWLAKCTTCPERMKDTAALEEGDRIVAYFSLVDRLNRYATASGKLTISLNIEFDGVLVGSRLIETRDVQARDFERVTIGLGGFARPAIICPTYIRTTDLYEKLFPSTPSHLRRTAMVQIQDEREFYVIFEFTDHNGRSHYGRERLPPL